MSDPRTRVEVIEGSLCCFVQGWLSLLPVLGLPFALWALRLSWKVQRKAGQDWNPAQRYLDWGDRLAILGLFISAIVGLFFVVVVSLGLADLLG